MKLKELESELNIYREELRKITRKQQELVEHNDELQKWLWKMKYQAESSKRKYGSSRRPYDIGKDKRTLSYWCFGEENQKRDCPHGKRENK